MSAAQHGGMGAVVSKRAWPAVAWLGVLLQFDLPVGHRFWGEALGWARAV
jgi:hypothetical protein